MNTRSFFIAILSGVMLFYFNNTPVYASYMLPYPSIMPGNKIYKITRIIDDLKAYWYFGDIAQVKYHILLADKYLVEAKTLMEYQQYLLGQDALVRSDAHFSQLTSLMDRVSKSGKNEDELRRLITAASEAHITTINALQSISPKEFTWTPENDTATKIYIHEMYGNSKKIRMAVKADIQF